MSSLLRPTISARTGFANQTLPSEAMTMPSLARSTRFLYLFSLSFRASSERFFSMTMAAVPERDRSISSCIPVSAVSSA